MRVSLCVLSGSRRGEFLELDADEFCVGSEPSCDVCFSAEKDPAARGVCIRLHREDDGWRISPVSGRESLVNQQILEATLPIRSGDIVRLSPDGPDFRFCVVAVVGNDHPGGAAVSEGRPLDRGAATAAQRSPRFSLSAAAMTVAAAALVLVVVALSSRHGKDKDETAPPKQAEGASLKGSETTSPSTPPTELSGKPTVTTSVQNATAGSSPPVKVASSSPAPPPVEKRTVSEPAKGQTPATTIEAGPAPPVPAENASPLLVLAIENREKQTLQPFAAACAVEQQGRAVVLTTGRIARIMALFPQQYYAIVPGGAEASAVVVKLKRGQIFMHRLYVDNVDNVAPKALDTAQYFDVGVLLAEGKLPGGIACRPASRAKVEGIRSGAALQCWTVDTPPPVAYADGAIRDEQFRLKGRSQPVQLTRSVLLWTENEREQSAADRRLFELDGPSAAFLEGSPLLDSEGELVALYSKMPVAAGDEPRQKSPAAARKRPPRAALVDAEMIGALWTGKPSVMWVGYRAENRSAVPRGAGGK